jgi:hypothetical protein
MFGISFPAYKRTTPHSTGEHTRTRAHTSTHEHTRAHTSTHEHTRAHTQTHTDTHRHSQTLTDTHTSYTHHTHHTSHTHTERNKEPTVVFHEVVDFGHQFILEVKRAPPGGVSTASDPSTGRIRVAGDFGVASLVVRRSPLEVFGHIVRGVGIHLLI